jgi:hypothetical protein
VKITVRVRSRAGTAPALGVIVPVILSLREPLGTRSVTDSSGRALPDLGMYLPGRPTASP